MEEGFVRFMRKWFYFVGVAIAFVAMMFGVFFPAMAVIVIVIVLGLALFFIWYYYKYEVLKRDKHPVRNKPQRLMKVEDVEAHVSKMPDLEEIARLAAEGGPTVKGDVIEGSGMEKVERYIPLGEMLFPLSFVANREEGRYQEGSLEVSNPLCLWHTIPVLFSPENTQEGFTYMVHCSKCPQVGKPNPKSMEETRRTVEMIATATLRNGKMPMRDETLLEAVKRGRGELPG